MAWFRKATPSPAPVDLLYARVAASSRDAILYGPGGLPDTVEGRFESLVLHVQVVLRRLRRLPPPADDVAQELVDAVFAHLEIALREMGVGDFGVPKRMKKLATAFYDRLAAYDGPIEAGDSAALATEIAVRVAGAPPVEAARRVVAMELGLRRAGLDQILSGAAFGAGLVAGEAA